MSNHDIIVITTSYDHQWYSAFFDSRRQYGKKEATLIVNEVGDAIKSKFAAEVIQCPTTTEEWTTIVKQFEKRWHFPHFCGALDGKHVAVTWPWNTGSLYRNYKDFYSIVLMTLVDEDYMFLWIDVGSGGSTYDASI